MSNQLHLSTLRPILLVFFLLTTIVINAQDITWVGSPSGDGIHWSDPDNWDSGMLPSSGQGVLLENDSVELDISGVEIGWLTMNNAILVNRQDLLIINVDTFGIGMTDSKLYNKGEIVVDTVGNGTEDAGLSLIQSSFINDSSFILNQSAGIGIVSSDGTVQNNGKLILLECMIDGIFLKDNSIWNNQALMRIASITSNTIRISDASLLINHDSIQLTTKGNGLIIYGNSSIQNLPAATITLDYQRPINVSNSYYFGIQSDGQLSNQGTIHCGSSAERVGQGIRLTNGTWDQQSGSATILNFSHDGLYSRFSSTFQVGSDAQMQLIGQGNSIDFQSEVMTIEGSIDFGL